MRQFRLITTLFLLISISAAKDVRDPQKRKNIEQFRITAIPIEIISNDSIHLIIYFDIPNSALQFVKHDSGFSAGYEATVSIRDESKIQVARQIWTGSVDVVNYRETVSDNLYTTLFTNISVPALDLLLVGELFDKDTRETANKEISITLDKYRGETFLFPLVLLKNQPGNWGLGEDLKPVFGNKVLTDDDSYRLLISGRIHPGPFIITAYSVVDDDSTQWKETYEQITESDYFKLVLDIPKELLTGFSTEIQIELEQGEITLNKTRRISINNPGMPASIDDIDEAIDQIRYIASDEEQKIFNKAKKKEREALFRDFWSKRDPTPNTEKNELMAEYFSRVRYANKNFSSFLPGWRSDMGMIYIIFGRPDDVERLYASASNYSGQKWYYYSINRTFVFVDESGFGDFRLLTPYYGRSGW